MSDNPIKITAEIVVEAYKNGYFPMARTKTAKDLEWLLPYDRGILDFDQFHLSKTMKKFIRKTDLKLNINQNFAAVIEECSKTHKGRDETWINDQIKSLYIQLHEMGIAHSIEVYSKDDDLVGGLYGLSIGAGFFGESMFSRQTNASKYALAGLVAHLWKNDFELLDIQFPNDHFEQFGYEVISNKEYQKRLKKALAKERVFYESDPASGSIGATGTTSSPEDSLSEFLQSMSHTS